MTDQKHKSAQNEATAARWKRRVDMGIPISATIAKSATVRSTEHIFESLLCVADDHPSSHLAVYEAADELKRLYAALDYVAHSGLERRHLEDFARNALRLT